jgi:hypothetical protein
VRFDAKTIRGFMDWLCGLPALAPYLAPIKDKIRLKVRPSGKGHSTGRATIRWADGGSYTVNINVGTKTDDAAMAELILHELIHFCSDAQGRLIGKGGHRDGFYRLLIKAACEAWPGMEAEHADALRDIWKIRHRYRKDDELIRIIRCFVWADSDNRCYFRTADGTPVRDSYTFTPGLTPNTVIVTRTLMAARDTAPVEIPVIPSPVDYSGEDVLDVLKNELRGRRDETEIAVKKALALAGEGLTVPDLLDVAIPFFPRLGQARRKDAHYEIWSACVRMEKRRKVRIEKRKGGAVIHAA